jgi:hypothetical protein
MIMQKLPAFPREFSEFAAATGFEPHRDLDAVTAGRIGDRGALVIAKARYDRFKVEQFIQDKADDLGTETYLGRVIYFGNRQLPENGGGVAFIDDLIVAGKVSAVKAAIDRMAAPAPSVVQNTELMNQIRTIEAGNQIWAAGRFDENSFPLPMRVPSKVGELAHSLKSGTYQMRVDQDLHLKATGGFNTPEMAKATNDMLRGLVAMAKLQVSQEEKLVHLLDGLSIESSGETLTISFNATGSLLKELQTLKPRALFGH